VLVNLAFRQSFLTLKNGDGAYVTFLVFYAVCFVVTWAVFIAGARDASRASSPCLVEFIALRRIAAEDG
jgi:nitrate/nitrite transporter NarK